MRVVTLFFTARSAAAASVAAHPSNTQLLQLSTWSSSTLLCAVSAYLLTQAGHAGAVLVEIRPCEERRKHSLLHIWAYYASSSFLRLLMSWAVTLSRS